MRFLKYHYSRTKMDYDSLNEASIEELVKLRDSISAFRRLCDNWSEHLSSFMELKLTHPDFKTLWMNMFMFSEVLDRINGVIGRRNMAKRQKELKKNGSRD